MSKTPLRYNKAYARKFSRGLSGCDWFENGGIRRRNIQTTEEQKKKNADFLSYGLLRGGKKNQALPAVRPHGAACFIIKSTRGVRVINAARLRETARMPGGVTIIISIVFLHGKSQIFIHIRRV